MYSFFTIFYSCLLLCLLLALKHVSLNGECFEVTILLGLIYTHKPSCQPCMDTLFPVLKIEFLAALEFFSVTQALCLNECWGLDMIRNEQRVCWPHKLYWNCSFIHLFFYLYIWICPHMKNMHHSWTERQGCSHSLSLSWETDTMTGANFILPVHECNQPLE